MQQQIFKVGHIIIHNKYKQQKVPACVQFNLKYFIDMIVFTCSIAKALYIKQVMKKKKHKMLQMAIKRY